ncbi:hypothetical protein D3C87_1807070 [compost metagenome]
MADHEAVGRLGAGEDLTLALAEQAAQDAFAQFGLAGLALLNAGAGRQLSARRSGHFGDVLASANTTGQFFSLGG